MMIIAIGLLSEFNLNRTLELPDRVKQNALRILLSSVNDYVLQYDWKFEWIYEIRVYPFTKTL
jgi:hypothetical protein